MITQIIPPVIWYNYKGDEICWNGKQYISLLCEGEFNSLEEMDEFWISYFEDSSGTKLSEEQKQLYKNNIW